MNKNNPYPGRIPAYRANAYRNAPMPQPVIKGAESIAVSRPVQPQVRQPVREVAVEEAPAARRAQPRQEPAPLPAPVPPKEEQPWVTLPEVIQPPANEQPLAMVTMPMQKWGQTYEPSRGLNEGTIFPQLNLPFMGKGARR